MYLLLLLQAAQLPSAWEDGYVTYYGGVPGGGGACSFPGEETNAFPNGMYAAADFTLFDSNKACGACYELKCEGPFTQAGANNCQCATKTIVMQVDNSCCTRDHNLPHFDLNPAAMKALITNNIGTCGVAAIKFRQVSCAYNAEGKNVKLVSKGGTSEYWYAFFVRDVAGTGMIEKARIRPSGSSTWVTCQPSGAFYLCDSSPPPFKPPFTVELTDSLGEVLVVTDAIKNVKEKTEFDFGTNFGRSASTPKPATPATPVPTPMPTPMPTQASTPAPTPLPPGATPTPATKPPPATPQPPGATPPPSTPMPPGATPPPTTPQPPGATPNPVAAATPQPPGATPPPSTPMPPGATPQPPGATTPQPRSGATPGPAAPATPVPGGAGSTPVPGTSGQPPASTPSPNASPTTPKVPAESNDDGLSAGVWIAIALGILGFLLCSIAATVMFLSRKKDKEKVNFNSFVESMSPQPMQDDPAHNSSKASI